MEEGLAEFVAKRPRLALGEVQGPTEPSGRQGLGPLGNLLLEQWSWGMGLGLFTQVLTHGQFDPSSSSYEN